MPAESPPAAPPAAAPQTKLQADIAAKTKAAVLDTGFEADFDAAFDAARAADDLKAGRTPETPVTPPKPPAEKPKAKEKPAPVADIPAELLGEKKKSDASPTGGEAKTDDEREKFIKEQTAGLSPKAADRFRAIEKAKHEAEQKAARTEKLERELAETQEKLKAASDNAETKALKKKLEELDEIVSKAALSEHPKFKAAFDNQIAKAVATAKKQVGDDAAAEVEALLSLPDTAQRNRRLNEILQDLEPVQAGKFTKAIAEVDTLSAERTAQLGAWRENKVRMQELAEKDAAENAQAREKQVESALKAVVPKFTNAETGIELFRKVDGNEEWNKSVETRLENVKKLTAADLGREDIAEMAAWAMSGAEYRKLFLTQRALVLKLQEELEAMKGGEPGLGAGGAGETDVEEEGGMIDIIARQARKSGAVR